MRKKNHEQLPLTASVIDHPRAKELEQISRILDSIPTINEMVGSSGICVLWILKEVNMWVNSFCH